jgi:hypothetical protein
MGGIIALVTEVPIPGHYPTNEEVFQAMEDFLRLRMLLADGPDDSFQGYSLDEFRGIDRHSRGIVPEAVGAWTQRTEGSEPIRLMVRRTDWRFVKLDGQETTIMTVQMEQH